MADPKHLAELAIRASRTGRTCFSRFLEPQERAWAEKAARDAGTGLDFFGGYPEAERAVACFLPPEEDPPEDPVVCLDIRWDARYASIGHRDLLGALMGLQLDREVTGDIVLDGEGLAYLFVLRELAPHVAELLVQAGRAPLRLTRHEGEVICPEPPGVRSRITFASPRLDAVLAAAVNCSRSEAQRRINAGLVKLDHVVCLRTDTAVGEGALLSVRGEGRIRLEEMTGETRHGRCSARIFRYGAK